MKKVAVIMAGGIGARLWPRSREKHPKQFTHIVGDGTMIQNTVMRLMPLFEREDIFIVTNKTMEWTLREQLPSIPQENIIMEPFGRNTAPSIALSALHIQERYQEDVILTVLPSDHLITNVREFQSCLQLAAQAAEQTEGIITIGVTPTHPEKSLGYIQISDDQKIVPELYDYGLRHVATFAEKPDIETAKRFVKAGDFLWNAGIYVWKTSTFWTSFETFLPDHLPLFTLLKKHINKATYEEILENVYRQLRTISIDYGITEKSSNVFVIEADFGWSDVGSWDEVYRLAKKDVNDNVLEGNVIAIDTQNCYISSREKLIGVIGIEDLIIVDSDIALLICKREESQDVKDLVNFLRRKQINHFL